MPARAAWAATELARLPGRGAGGHLEAELAGLGQGDRDHPVLERAGRVGRVVLDPQLAQAELGRQAVGPHQGREAGAEVDRRRRRSPGAGPGSARWSAGPLAMRSRLTVAAMRS